MYKRINGVRSSNKMSSTYLTNNPLQPITKRENDTKVENPKLVNNGQNKLKQNACSFNNCE